MEQDSDLIKKKSVGYPIIVMTLLHDSIVLEIVSSFLKDLFMC